MGGKRKGEPLLMGGKLRATFAAGNLRSVFSKFSTGPLWPRFVKVGKGTGCSREQLNFGGPDSGGIS